MSLKLLFDGIVGYVIPAAMGCLAGAVGIFSWRKYHEPRQETTSSDVNHLSVKEAALPMFLTMCYFIVILFVANVVSWLVIPPQRAKCLAVCVKCLLACFALVVHIILLQSTLPKPLMQTNFCEYVLPVVTVSMDLQFILVALFTEIGLHLSVLMHWNLTNRVIAVADFYTALFLCGMFVNEKMLCLFAAVSIIHNLFFIIIAALQLLLCFNISQDVDYYACVMLLVVRWFRIGEIILHVVLIYFLSNNIIATAFLGQIINIVIYICMKWNRMSSLP